MEKIRFALVGSGWRAEFYVRIAKAMPDRFELTGVLERDPEKGRGFARLHGVPAVVDMEDLLATAPDFVAVAVARGHVPPVLEQLFKKGVPTLCETPPAESLDELNALWVSAAKLNARIQIAEQYFSQPLYAAWESALKQNIFGEIENINISSLHGYHAISIIRRFLGVGFENCAIYGKRYQFNVIDTLGRQGIVQNGSLRAYRRDRLTLEFENGKIAFFDFSDPIQYHSLIRTRQLTVQGTRGEIDDLTARYLTDGGLPVTVELNRVDFGVYGNQEWSNYGLFLGEKQLYASPFFPARLNDDELAVATCMVKMKEYLDSGVEFYSLREALQDAYARCCKKSSTSACNSA